MGKTKSLSANRGDYALVSFVQPHEEHGILEEDDPGNQIDAEELMGNGSLVVDHLLEKDADGLPSRREELLVKKIDRRVMPCLIAMIILNYLDRNALANARVQGIEASLGLTGSQFNTAISVFFIGYIGLQVPSNLLLTRVQPSIYLPGCMIAWGCLSGLTAYVSSFRGLVLVRFFLGMVEAPFFPGALFLLSSWYTKRELAFRTSLLYSGSLLSGAFGGFVGAGIEYGLNGFWGLRSWRWLFILESSATILLAIVAMKILPNYPHTTRWLTDAEQDLAIARLQDPSNRGNKHEMPRGALLKGLKDAVTDYKLYFLSAIILTKTSAGAVTSFIPTLVATFGLSRIPTLLLVAPPYVCAAITGLLVSYSSDKRAERAYHIVAPISLGFIGFALFGLTLSSVLRYLSLFFMLAGVYGSYNVALAWISSTLPSPAEKRSVAIAIINTIGNCAQIYSPYLYLKENGPRYAGAMVADSIFCLACVALVIWLRGCLKRDNARLARTGDDFRYLL